MHGRIFEYMLYTFVFYGFFELLQKEDFFLCKPNFLSIMRVKGSFLFLKKMLIITLMIIDMLNSCANIYLAGIRV